MGGQGQLEAAAEGEGGDGGDGGDWEGGEGGEGAAEGVEEGGCAAGEVLVSVVDAFGFLGGRGEEDIRGLLVLGKRLALFEVGAGAKGRVDGRREDQGACWALLVGACHAAEALVPGR